MTKNDGTGRTPSRRERLRPAEYIGIAAVIAVFVGVVVLMSTRELVLSGIFFGIAFVVSLVLLALFALGFKPEKSGGDTTVLAPPRNKDDPRH